MAIADVAVRAGRGWGVMAMNDSSSALREPTLAPRFQTFATSQFASDRSTNEILHTDVILAGPNPQSLDQRAWQLRGQRVNRFVSFDTRARHSARIRPPADGSFTRAHTARPHTGLLVCPTREKRVRQR